MRIGPLRTVLLWLALALAWACVPARADPSPSVHRLDAATAQLQPGGAPAFQREVALPYAWDTWHRGQHGSAQFDMAFVLDDLDASVPYGLYLPRLGNAYEVRLNGLFLERNGALAGPAGSDFAQQPRHISIPPDLLARSNLLQVRVRTDTGRRGGLSQLYIGPEAQTMELYLQAYHTRVTASTAIVGFSLFVGLMALTLWATQTDTSTPGRPRRDPLYLFAGLAELCWTARVGDALVEIPPLPWPLWGVVPVVAMGAWVYCMSQFCIHAADWSRHRAAVLFGRWIGVLALLSGPLAYYALGHGAPLALTLWYASVLASFLAFGALFVLRSLRRAQWSSRWIALAMLLNIAVGARDFYVFRVAPAYPDNSWMRYSSVVFGVALAYFVVTRFRSASTQARDLLANLATRVAEKERALQESYARVESLAREQARSLERASILRDMHDGVGAHISSAIRQMQSGMASSDEVLQTLRDSLDQLKLTIDSMHLPAGDVTALLANLRYRLTPRFAASGIELQWDVDQLPPMERLDAQAMRHLQFAVFEALSNVLQHSDATTLRIAVKPEAGGLVLRIVDNGQGFDVHRPWHKGLQSLRERAAAIGADLSITSRPGETAVALRLRH